MNFRRELQQTLIERAIYDSIYLNEVAGKFRRRVESLLSHNKASFQAMCIFFTS